MQKFMLLCLSVSFLIFPISAVGTEYISKDTFWNWAAGSNGVVKQVINFVGGLGTCPKSEDTYHHASSYQKEGNLDGDIRYQCVCDYCHQSFTAYASDLQQSYDTQVSELPAQGVTSAGRLVWQPSFSDCVEKSSSNSPFVVDCRERTSRKTVYLSDIPTSDFVSVLSGNNGFKCSYINSSFEIGYTFCFELAVSGLYRRIKSTEYSYSYVDNSGVSHSDSKICSADTSFVHYDSSYKHSVYKREFSICSAIVPYGIIYLYFPVYEIIPDTIIDPGSASTGDTYNINSRPTSITGNYGIIGDNGQITKVEGNTIVNETSEITNWNYDYSTRTYSLTLNGGDTTTTTTGDTVTVTYGDENVTINETTINESGDTITNNYTIYYLVQGSGSENPDPGPDVPGTCDHTWTETGRTDPTCTMAGKVTSKCSKCGQTKTETIPANGHSWVVDRTVQTEYDEEGNLLQQGYTIYSCSVCGEQYKDMEGTGPPGGDGEKSIWEKLGDLIGSGFGGIIEIIEAILGKILDALTSLLDMIMGKLKGIVESILTIFDELPALFDGFLDFLGAIFPFLPPEITTILTFGVIAITFIGILKAVRR